MILFRKYLLLSLTCLLSIYASGQNRYLLCYEHKVKGGSENTYFYLEPLGQGLPPALPRAKVLTLDSVSYRVNYMRLSEEAPSWYVGCTLYGNQARGEELSLNRLLSDSVLRVSAERQRALEAECGSLFDNKGKQNSMLAVALNSDDKLKLIKIDMEYCSCVAAHRQFSHLSDSLSMPRKVVKVGVFTDREKDYWENQLPGVLQNEFIKSCLPAPESYFRWRQAGRE
jgi:hypothetical protein